MGLECPKIASQASHYLKLHGFTGPGFISEYALLRLKTQLFVSQQVSIIDQEYSHISEKKMHRNFVGFSAALCL